jgi:hypothetical protein
LVAPYVIFIVLQWALVFLLLYLYGPATLARPLRAGRPSYGH